MFVRQHAAAIVGSKMVVFGGDTGQCLLDDTKVIVALCVVTTPDREKSFHSATNFIIISLYSSDTELREAYMGFCRSKSSSIAKWAFSEVASLQRSLSGIPLVAHFCCCYSYCSS
jgi:hypothetical protein